MVDGNYARLVAVELELGRRLYETIERLDPSPVSTPAWDTLSDGDREFYRLCVDALVEHGDALRAALDLTHDYEVGGRAQATE